MNTPSVKEYIDGSDGPQREIFSYFHELFTEELNLSAKIRYKVPFYYGKSWICYLNPIKNNSVELAFVRGHELSNANGILHSKGRKQVCGIDISNHSRMPENEIHETIQEAILLDETRPYESKNKKRTT